MFVFGCVVHCTALQAIDMWSVGCILGELLERKPIFRGTDYIHQVEKICETIGAPQDEDMTHITHKKARRRAAVRTRIIIGVACPPSTPHRKPQLDVRKELINLGFKTHLEVERF